MRAQGEGLPRQRRWREREMRLDLGGELIAEKNRPTAAESSRSAFPARWRGAFAPPPILERREEPGSARRHSPCTEPAIAIEPQCRRGGGEQHAGVTQRSCRRGI